MISPCLGMWSSGQDTDSAHRLVQDGGPHTDRNWPFPVRPWPPLTRPPSGTSDDRNWAKTVSFKGRIPHLWLIHILREWLEMLLTDGLIQNADGMKWVNFINVMLFYCKCVNLCRLVFSQNFPMDKQSSRWPGISKSVKWDSNNIHLSPNPFTSVFSTFHLPTPQL